MGATRRSFTDEYKTSAVSLVITDGKSIAETVRNIGVHEMTLGKWVKTTRDNGQGPEKPLGPDERKELERLRAENQRLRMEVAFSKTVAVSSRGGCNT